VLGLLLAGKRMLDARLAKRAPAEPAALPEGA